MDQVFTLTLAQNINGSAYCISSGSLPPGISGIGDCFAGLSDDKASIAPQSAVVISGTPTAAGFFPFTVRVTNGANSSSTNYQLIVHSPTAAFVSVGGRTVTPNGIGLGNATVQISDSNGSTQTVVTNPFGYFQFQNVEAGQNYILTVQSKRFQFTPQVVSVSDQISDLELVALP